MIPWVLVLFSGLMSVLLFGRILAPISLLFSGTCESIIRRFSVSVLQRSIYDGDLRACNGYVATER